MGFSKNSVFRILSTLCSRGYLSRDSRSQRFRLNGKLLGLAYRGVDSDPGHGDGTHRIRLAYDSVAHTVSFDLDKNYTGGAFVADIAIGSVSTSGLWSGSELGKIYVGGDDGVLLTDFDVVIHEGTLIILN